MGGTTKCFWIMEKWTQSRALRGNEAAMKPVLCYPDPFRTEAQIPQLPSADCWKHTADFWELFHLKPYFPSAWSFALMPPEVLSSAWGQLRPLLPLHHSSASPSTQSPIFHCSDADPECTPQHSFSVSPQSVSRGNQICNRGISRVGICSPRFQLTNIKQGRLYPRGATEHLK